MMSRAKHDEGGGLVAALLRTRLEVVRVDERRVAAARHLAAPAGASRDLAANHGWDGLLGASGAWRGVALSHVGADSSALTCNAHVGVVAHAHRSNVLRIALGHLHGCLAHLDLLAPPLLPAPAAFFANRESHLVTRA